MTLWCEGRSAHNTHVQFGENRHIFATEFVRILLILALALFPLNVALGKVVKPVASYNLDCNTTFSCPESLKPRVAFWVEVFSRWDTNTAIMHDKDFPHRVYSTFSRKQGCRKSKKGGKVDRERKRLNKVLTSLASKRRAGKSLSRTESEMNALFAGEPLSSIERAADRVRCQSGNKDRMRTALSHFMAYRPTILDALEKQSLTPELQYLPFVESAFNPEALSHVGAAGLWQIMPSTGRTLGLTVNQKVDERYDPVLATYAAAKYFRNSVDNLTETAFENGFTVVNKDLNPFVITSYNYGVKGMERAIKQVGLDYERLLTEYKSPSFQTAVKNFYASFLAARHVAKNSERFFGVIQHDTSVNLSSYNTEKLKRATSARRISKTLKVDLDRLKKFNPALKKVIWRHKGLVPKGYELKLPYKEMGWSDSMNEVYSLPVEREKSGYVWHRVKRGQTACGIAEKYRASCSALIKLNRLDKKGTIYVGRRIKVPSNNGGIHIDKVSSGDSTEPVIAGLETSQSSPQAVDSMTRYRVKRGDTACSVANRFGMRCNELLALNGLTRSSVIKIGQRLTVTSANSWHVVRRGQTACGIAADYRVRCSALLDANRLRRADTIQVGQRLRIPALKY